MPKLGEKLIYKGEEVIYIGTVSGGRHAFYTESANLDCDGILKINAGKSFFYKKPIIIEAIKFDGKNQEQIASELGTSDLMVEFMSGETTLRTLEGDMKVSVGDWIIKGVNGEFYPCKPDIFEKTYEPINARSK